MRNLGYLTLMALAVAACKNGGDDTSGGDDTGDSTPPTIVLTYDEGTATYNVKVDNVDVCSSSYDLSGSEYENGFCDNCEFMFSLTSAETARTDSKCPNPDPWRYTFSTPYPDAYADDKAGIAYTDHWYYAGYGYLPAYEMFFSFYHYGPYVYDYTIMSARIEGSSGAVYAPGTFSDSSGSVTWSYDPDAVYNARAAEFRNCSDTYISRIALQDYPSDFAGDEITSDNPTADGLDFAATNDGTIAGTLADCTDEERADAFTFTVAAGATAQLSVDVDTAKGFDPFLWVNDADGCTVKYSDDIYKCNGAAYTCSYVDSNGDTQQFSCCPSLEVENTGGSAATYTAWVSVAFGDTCVDGDAGNVAGYTLKYKGTTPAADGGKDDYRPKYELSASGTSEYTATEVR